MGRLRRLLRRCLRVTLVAGAALFGLVSVIYLCLISPWGNDWLRGQVLAAAEPLFPGGSLAVGEIDTNLLNHLVLKDVAIVDTKGKRLIGLDRLDLRWRLLGLLDKKLVVHSVRFEGPMVDLTVLEDGTLDIQKVFGPPKPDTPTELWTGLPIDVVVPAVVIVGGDVDIGGHTTPVKIAGLGLDLGISLTGPAVHVDHAELSLEMVAPYALSMGTEGELIFTGADLVIPELALTVGDSILKLEGRVGAVQTVPELDLGLQLAPLAPSTLEAVVGEPVLKQDLLLDARITGPLSVLSLDSTFSSDGLGELDLDMVLGLESDPMMWDIQLQPRNFRVDGLVAAVGEPVTLAGRYTARGHGTDWPAGIQAEIECEAGQQVLGGEAVAALGLEAVLNAGQLEIKRLRIEHSAMKLDLTGRADLIQSRAGVDLDLQIGRLDKLAAYGVVGVGGRAGFDGHVDADWASETKVDVDGQIRLGDIRASGTHVLSGSGEVRAKVLGTAAQAEGRMVLNGIRAPGAGVEQVSFAFEGSQSAGGDIALDAGLEVMSIEMDDGSLSMAELSGELRARVPARGALVARAKLDVSNFTLNKGAYQVDGGPVIFEASGDAVWADIDLRRQDAPFVKGRIDGDLATGEWRVSGFEFALKPNDGLVAQQNISVTLGEDGAESVLMEIDNLGGRGRIRLEGRATAADPNLHIEVDKVSLSYVMEMLEEVMGKSGVVTVLGPEVEDEEAGPVFPGDGGEPEAPPSPESVAARTEQQVSMSGLAGLASMDLKIRKKDGALFAKGWVEVEDLVVPGQVSGGQLRLQIKVDKESAVYKLRVRAGEQLVVFSEGEVPIKQVGGEPVPDCEREADVRAMVPALKLGRLAQHVPELAGVDGRISVDLRLQGPACNPDLELVAAADMAVGSQDERARVDLDLKRIGDKIVVKATVEEDSKPLLSLNSEVDARIDELVASLQGAASDVVVDKPETWINSFQNDLVIQAVDLKNLARLGGVNHPLEGVLGGSLRLAGTPSQPVLSGGAVLVNGRIGEAGVEQATFALIPASGGYELVSNLIFEGDGELHVQGHVPLDLGALDLNAPGLNIELSGQGVPLAMAEGPDGLSDPEGLLSVQGQITGTLDKPIPVLGLKTDSAAFSLMAAGLRYEPVDVDIKFSPEQLDIRRFEVHSRPLWSLRPRTGSLDLEGTVDLEFGIPTKVDVKAKMDEFWLASLQVASLAVSGDLDIDGVFPDLRIVGALAADEARFEVGEAQMAEVSGLELDERLVLHREKGEIKTLEPVEEEESISDYLDIDLKLDLQQRLMLKAEVPLSGDLGSQFSQLATFTMDMSMDGKLDLKQRRGQLEVVGELVPIRGFLEALGKRFDLQEGRMVFTGANYTDPVLDLSASHQVGQYGAVDIKITGTADDPLPSFSSAEYPDQTDVMSMLLFGKPPSAMSETEGESGSGLLSAALSSVGGQAARSSGAAFLQNVSLDPGSGSVKVGFPLSDKVYLAVERLNPESETDNMTQASVEWILSRQTYAEVITGDQGKSSGDLYWRWRF
jgi:autotransporter translocation and assembly factor TamB